MEYLDFVIDNYIWFLVGGIVLIMTIIGYVAEKTEFGKKSKKNSKKETKTVAQEEPEVFEQEEVNEEVELPLVEEVEETVEPEEELQNETIEESNEEPMEDLDEIEIKEPAITEDLETPLSEEVEEDSIPEELYAGLDGTPNLYKNDDETDFEEKEDKFDIDLPNIEGLKEDTIDSDKNILEDDDIWKF